VTTVVVVLIGVGVMFIASALDCTSIKTTFFKIVQNQAIDWSGSSANCNQATVTPPVANAPASIGAGPTLINTDANGNCPAGYTRVYVSGGKAMCQPK
jgi:hypothetical protein